MSLMDFTKINEKYPLLSSKDISFLNNFFNEEKYQKLLAEFEKNRQKKIKYLSILFILWLFIAPIFYWPDNFTIDIILIFIYSLFISLIIVGIFGFLTLAITSIFVKEKSIKNDLLPDFVSKINTNIKYSKTNSYFGENLSYLKSIGLLKKYTRVDKKEDSIKYLIGDEYSEIGDENIQKVESGTEKIEITGCEIKTSEKRRRKTKNGTQTYYVVTNHCYMMKIDFKDPKFDLKEPIRLSEDVNDNMGKKAILVAFIEGIIIWLLLYIPSIMDLALSNFPIFISLVIGLYPITWLIYSQIINENRVKLENNEFEKKFDVYSEDQIESRRLLTPSFMYRLVDYVNKIDNKRVYEMYFHKNLFYVKFNLLKTPGGNKYLEISNWKNVYKNLEDYVKFYLELKNINSLVGDLKLFYYDKGIMNEKIIK